jgi:hypothetical protein
VVGSLRCCIRGAFPTTRRVRSATSSWTVAATSTARRCRWAHGYGNIFKLIRDGIGWTYTDLYDFQDKGDGAYPTGDLIIDSEGNIYGTNTGDQSGHGVVWKVTP